MIKECKIVSYNKFLNILVFNYDDKQIQTTVCLKNEDKTVFVEYKNGKYVIVNKDEYDKSLREKQRKKKEIDSTLQTKIYNGEL